MPEYHGWTHAPKEQGGTDPIPGMSASDGIWGYMVTAPLSFTLTATGWEFPPIYDEYYLSDLAQSEGWISPHATEFQFGITEKGEGGLWVVEAKGQFLDYPGTAVAGDWYGIGNLMAAGSSLNVEDTHVFQPADLISSYADDNVFSNLITRVIPNTQALRYVSCEFGNFCFASSIDVKLIQAELIVYRAAPGHGNQLP